jgi:Na+-driven multidrug efflux pump
MLTTRDVVRFWVPLSLTWLMMAIEGPILTSVIARLPDDELNLAAYGVALALAMLIESPVIQLLSTSVALARDRRSMHTLRRFTRRVNIGVTIGMIVVTLPWVYDVIANGILQLPAEVSAVMRPALIVLIPWPAAIGYRRFYQGLMIRNGKTRLVAYGTVVRLLTMMGAAWALLGLGTLDGVVIGAAGLTVGVICEAIATRIMCSEVLKSYEEMPDSDVVLTNDDIWQFWMPLALTSLIGFIVTPMLTFFMVRAPLTLTSLAVLPVVDSLVFIFRSFGFSYQEVGVALIGDRFQNYEVVRRVGVRIVIVTTALLAVIATTPLLSMIYVNIYGLRPDLAEFARVPTYVLMSLPFIAVAYSLYRSALITARQNVKVTISTMLEVGGIACTMILLVGVTNLNGALAAALSMAAGRSFSTLYLRWNARQLAAAMK